MTCLVFVLPLLPPDCSEQFFTEQLAYQNAPYGVRANAILPGLMDTPMAVDTRAYAWGKTREEVAAQMAGYPPGSARGIKAELRARSDIDPDTFNLDPESVEALLRSRSL